MKRCVLEVCVYHLYFAAWRSHQVWEQLSIASLLHSGRTEFNKLFRLDSFRLKVEEKK